MKKQLLKLAPFLIVLPACSGGGETTTDASTTKNDGNIIQTDANIIQSDAVSPDGNIALRDAQVGITLLSSCRHPSAVAPACTGTSGPILCVDINSSGIENGSAQAPFQSISAAVQAAQSGDIILVAQGQYTENISIEEKEIFLQGGFPGNGDFQISTPRTNQSKVTAVTAGSVFWLFNAGNSLIDGFHISGGSGYVKFQSERAEGGGVYTENGYPTISCNIIENNDIRNDGSEDDIGGGVSMRGNGAILDNLIQNNFAARGAGLYGGGTVLVEGNEIRNNTAIGDHGGGMFLAGKDMEVYDNLVIGNEVGRSLTYGWGGGILVISAGSTAKMAFNIITENYAPTKGSGFFLDNGASATSNNDLIFNNQCSEDGGTAIYVDRYEDDGNSGSVLTLTNATIVNNDCATRDGGNGVYVEGPGSKAIIMNSIFWGNQDDFFTTGSGQIDIEYSISQETIGGTQNIVSDPFFADTGIHGFHLQSTSGHWNHDTKTWVLDAVNSPGLDKGAPSSTFSKETIPNGSRRNIGVYGNTAESSKSDS